MVERIGLAAFSASPTSTSRGDAAIGLIDGVVEHNNKVWDIAAAAALVEESGAAIHYLNQSPFPMKEFTLKASRVQYVAGNQAMVAKLREILGR